MNLITCVDKDFGIGFKGSLLIRIPEDLKQFKEKTTGKAVVYGRKTLETFPGSKPLPNRRNIVLTQNPNLIYSLPHINGRVDICFSVKNTMDFLSVEGIQSKDVFIIGGESVYRQFADYCDTAYVTEVDKRFDKVDAYFPDLTAIGWKKEVEGDWIDFEDTRYRFSMYKV